MGDFDAAATAFDDRRSVPDGVAQAVRASVLRAARPQPRILDVGAGTGRFGWPFVVADDCYAGADLSFEMLLQFRERAHAPCLVQADGQILPFPDAAFDVVILFHAVGAVQDPRKLLAEARRALRPAGVLAIGRLKRPANGVDARMKDQLAAILAACGAAPAARDAQEQALNWLRARAASSERQVAARWRSEQSPRSFIERHRTGARFLTLPEAIQNVAMRELAAWAQASFGSLDGAMNEALSFELQLFRFQSASGS